LPVEALAGKISHQSGCDEQAVVNVLNTYINEARVSFRLIEHDIAVGHRVLEVGSGLCLLSFFLHREGFNIVALEPALGGFELFDVAKNVIADHFSESDLPILECTAQALDDVEHGQFDLIFSNNVLEHIPEWEQALAAMRGVLTTNGYMLHACPNYTFPYEPHYGVPVFRHFPQLSKRLFLPADADEGIWHSLNFITCTQVKRFCARHRLRCSFSPGLLYRAMLRLESDPLFRERHQGVVAAMAVFALRSGLARILRLMPASLTTPMIMRLDIVNGDSA